MPPGADVHRLGSMLTNYKFVPDMKEPLGERSDPIPAKFDFKSSGLLTYQFSTILSP